MLTENTTQTLHRSICKIFYNNFALKDFSEDYKMTWKHLLRDQMCSIGLPTICQDKNIVQEKNPKGFGREWEERGTYRDLPSKLQDRIP